jgi:F-type H+-transporting ATPase subunit delta
VLTEYKLQILGNVLRERVGRLTLEFLRLLIAKGRIGRLASMIAIYLRLLEEHQGILEAEVTTAVPLDEARSVRLRAALERLTKKKILLRPSVDASILGGVVVHYGDTIVDGSVARKLRDIREDLGRLRVH